MCCRGTLSTYSHTSLFQSRYHLPPLLPLLLSLHTHTFQCRRTCSATRIACVSAASTNHRTSAVLSDTHELTGCGRTGEERSKIARAHDLEQRSEEMVCIEASRANNEHNNSINTASYLAGFVSRIPGKVMTAMETQQTARYVEMPPSFLFYACAW